MAWKTRYVKGANGKETKFPNGGYIINVTIPANSIDQLGSFTSKKGEKYYTFKVSPLRNGQDDYGNTHSISVSERDDEETTTTATTHTGGGNQNDSTDDLPF